MTSPDKEAGVSFAAGSSRHLSPPPAGLRQRPLQRAATFAEPTLNRRRSSIFSESLSDAKRSIRSSTDDLFLPRATTTTDVHDNDESSHWHSLPLGLALFPAVGGLFFKDGSAIITDVTLLVIAAVFMNWALRMPWEWYRAAQTLLPTETTSSSPPTPIPEEDESVLSDGAPETSPSRAKVDKTADRHTEPLLANRTAAETELRLHELAALCSCFLCPALAAWLLHAIRSQLSRPSEGLVSNYNLTIFLLVAEIRPMSHLIKMIQRRTLFLQRRVNLETLQDSSHPVGPHMDNLLDRIVELEAHVADNIAAQEAPPTHSPEQTVARASAQAIADVRKIVQPELDALGRAMRRYEKKSTVSAVQIEARLQELEVRVGDVVVLAAAAQRSAEKQPMKYYLVVVNWLCAAIVIPLEAAKAVLLLPSRLYSQLISAISPYVPWVGRPRRSREGKAPRRVTKAPSHDRDKRAKPAA
ncbi:uncharacterized protein HMPREF1541_04925 [Cyphellophora europaea CBS 101466]|uniref:Uncharacterized protein n=1 Tax=Cyphellophora europaea (strain CBS 101466) TaxID=1220924 RepID=W2RVU7_CYPE1|nr:uncharacterized protein HMPREF1541_04925 [Cyphellophora europaea CBS 101466]ETN40646.1 hypothetical protein HMPREF1541_04925 [Cyphellophora europaea CBS 101466]